MNGNLPKPGEFAFCTSLPPIVVEAHRSVIRDFLTSEEEIYKLTFQLFILFKKGGISKTPLTTLFCDHLYLNQIIKAEAQPINALGPYAFNEYWQIALGPSFWPNHAYELDNLLVHADVIQRWQNAKTEEIDAIESQLSIFRGRLAA